MARGNVHFQQHAWGYFAFKPFLRCSDDGSLPLVEKICNSMGFRVANRLRVGKVRTAGCFSALPLLRIMKRVDFQKSPLSDIIWRGAKVDMIATSSLAVGRFAAKKDSLRSPSEVDL